MRGHVATATQGISLFPFLAVLLCTMGALIVVLVVLNRQSRLQAEALSTAEAESRRSQAIDAQQDAELQRDIAAWRLDHLRMSRDKTQTDLDRQRLRLSGVEEHRRQLEAQLKQVQRAATEQGEPQPTDAGGSAADQLAQLEVEIRSARQQLVETRQRVADRATAYSVVPYDGPNRTRRRPIYIECTAEGVVIQPEGIVLSASDFDGPMGPGNPLASAVRAARDHLVAQAADSKSPDAEPYPLFLVRPDGIEAYYAARAAMQSWGADFGYQTVDQDWMIEYPVLDARLAEIERQAIDEARQRMRWLAQMSPHRYGAGDGRQGSGGKIAYRVSPLGGLIREGGPTLRDGAAGFGGGGRDRRGSFSSKGNRRLLDESVPGSASTAGGMRSKRDRAGMPVSRSDTESKTGSIDDQVVAGHSSSVKAAERRYGDLNDRSLSSDRRTADIQADATGSAHSDPPTGQTEADAQLASKPKDKPRSLAETRGTNWGLSPAARASNPITRPIHIVCEGDKLLVRSERSSDRPVAVPLQLRTEESVDQLVAEVQKRIEDWGIAGRGLYWRPQLILEVGQSGEGRYFDLEALLADSGFDVKRR